MSTVNSVIATLRKQLGHNPDGPIDLKKSDIYKIGNHIVKKVTDFIVTSHLGKSDSITANHFESVVCNEAFDATKAFTSSPTTAISTLVRECGIDDPGLLLAASEEVTNIINKYFDNKKPGALLAHQQKEGKGWDTSASVMGLESLYSMNLVNMFNTSFHTEDFGAGIGTILPDLRMAIAVSIMQFHNGLTARVLPVKTATEPVVQYKRQDLKVYSVADTEESDKDLIELFQEPNFLSNQLIKVAVKKANDTESVLVSDGVVKFGVTAHLMKLALDPNVYGTDMFNRTDLIADGVKIDNVIFTISNGTTTEQFKVAVPLALSKLLIMNNALHSAMRGTSIVLNTFLNKDSVLASGAATTLLGAFTDEGLNVEIRLTPEINLRTSEMYCMGAISIKKHHITDNTLISPALDTFYASLYSAAGAHQPALVGYSPDARYEEQNMRKSQTAIRIQTRHLVQPIPPGKNYILETAMGQNEEDNGASHLTQVIRIGQDDKTLTTLRETTSHIYDLVSDMFNNPLRKGVDPGHAYVAGSIVRPRVRIQNISANDITSMKDSDRMSDIRSMVQYKLSYILEDLMRDSQLIAQLPSGQRPTFKIITSSVLLNNLFGVQHIHPHMNAHTPPAYDGIEYSRTLDSGVTLQFVTTLFNSMKDKILILPCIPGDPDSILNWGHNWDFGTVVGNYNHNHGNAIWNRTFANTREISLPTNPMAVLLTVSGVDTAVKLPD